MPNANNLDAGGYTYGMNGMMRDNEVKGNGNSYTSYWRQYDPRLGRWMSDEPKPVAWESGYAAFRNNPIYFADPTGDFPNVGQMVKSVGNFFKNIGQKIGDAFKGKKGKSGGEFGGFEQICDGCGSSTNPIDMSTFELVDNAPKGGSSPVAGSFWSHVSEVGSGVLTLAVQFDNFMKNLPDPDLSGSYRNDELMGNGSTGNYAGMMLVTQRGGGNAEQGGQAIRFCRIC